MPSPRTLTHPRDVQKSARFEVRSYARSSALNRGLHRVLELLLVTAAFCLIFVGGSGEAKAAPSGMCSNDAQSIPAPPPLFPADDAILRGCDGEEDFELSSMAHRTPGERIAPDTAPDDPKCVLEAHVPLPTVTATLRPRENTPTMTTSEHRWQGLRPPCHG